MKTVDPGHTFDLTHLDGNGTSILRFVKRIGDDYPGNEAPGYEGTNLQEVFRACIARLLYVNQQIRAPETTASIESLREALWLLEIRAARRHLRFADFAKKQDGESRNVEDIPTCRTCGHIYCDTRNHPIQA